MWEKAVTWLLSVLVEKMPERLLKVFFGLSESDPVEIFFPHNCRAVVVVGFVLGQGAAAGCLEGVGLAP